MIMGSLPLSTAVSVYMTLTLVLAMSCNCRVESAKTTSNVPALFVFGDSLLDTGNNADLITIARAASPPYGEDMGSGGRFSNGPITTDFIAGSLNLPCPPPYVSAGDNIERGVNFASAASGILDGTGDIFGQHYSMPTQLKNFQDVKERLEKKVGTEVSSSIISKAIFYITTGSNDFFLSYYSMPPNPVYAFLSPGQFSDLLVSNFNDQLKSLYKLGARKFAVTGIPPVGCTPYAFWRYPNRAKDGEDGCIDSQIFLRIHNAYVTLSDPQDRAQYDRQLLGQVRGFAGQTWGKATTGRPPVYKYSGQVGRSWETDQCWLSSSEFWRRLCTYLAI